MAIELEVEKEVARRAIAALPTSSIEHKSAVGAHYSRSLRFFAEGQANAVVVGLHGLANLMARTLEFDIDLTPTELRALGMTRAEFAPGSTARKSWLSWTAATLSNFLTMASTRASEIQTVAAELDQLSREQAIIDLLEFRNTQYHRWRGESAGVTGIAHGEPTAADILAAGQSVSFGLVTRHSGTGPDHGGGARQRFQRCARRIHGAYGRPSERLGSRHSAPLVASSIAQPDHKVSGRPMAVKYLNTPHLKWAEPDARSRRSRGGHDVRRVDQRPLSPFARYRYTVSRWMPYWRASSVLGTPAAAWARSSVTCSAVSEGRRPL